MTAGRFNAIRMLSFFKSEIHPGSFGLCASHEKGQQTAVAGVQFTNSGMPKESPRKHGTTFCS